MIKPEYYNKFTVTKEGISVYPLDLLDRYQFMPGNVLKYLIRYQDKGQREDLEKALTYLDQMEHKEKVALDPDQHYNYKCAVGQLEFDLMMSNSLVSEFIQLDQLYKDSGYSNRKYFFFNILRARIKQAIESLDKTKSQAPLGTLEKFERFYKFLDECSKLKTPEHHVVDFLLKYDDGKQVIEPWIKGLKTTTDEEKALMYSQFLHKLTLVYFFLISGLVEYFATEDNEILANIFLDYRNNVITNNPEFYAHNSCTNFMEEILENYALIAKKERCTNGFLQLIQEYSDIFTVKTAEEFDSIIELQWLH